MQVMTQTRQKKMDNMEKFKLPFRRISISDKQAVEEYTAKIDTNLCDHCFTDLFIWQDHYHTEICFYQDFLLIKYAGIRAKTPMYLAPVGQGNIAEAVELLQQDAAARQIPFVLTSITEKMLPEYQVLLQDDYDFVTSEDAVDYIYLSEKLQTLRGKKLQSKRNLVNRFLKQYDGAWRYVDITPENIETAYAFHLKWCEKNSLCDSDSFRGETCAIRVALNHFVPLQMCGGMLYLNDEVIAFTLGSKMNDEVFVVQIEKADSEIQGAYQMINQQFVQRHCTDVTYVNREDDLGLEGLRKAKRSYDPEIYSARYTAIPKTE